MNINEMNRNQLRSACRDAKVKGYAKLTKEQMVAALTALQPTAVLETAFTGKSGRDNQLLADVFPAPQMKPIKRGKAKDAAPVAKVEREIRNGVKRPLDPTSKTGQVWTALDELVAKGETDLTTAIHAVGDKRGWNKNNTSCELSAYRKFHGISKETKAA